jgi:hypothetical protein
MPQLRAVFLERLEAADPAGLERLLGAISWAIEDIITAAPDEPLPRWRLVWPSGDQVPHLEPDGQA